MNQKQRSWHHWLSLTILFVSILVVTCLAIPLQALPSPAEQDQSVSPSETIDLDPEEQEPPFDPPPPREWVGLEIEEIVTPNRVYAQLGEQTAVVVKIHNHGNIAARNVTIELPGERDLIAQPREILFIGAGKTRSVILPVEVRGRFVTPLPFFVQVKAENSSQQATVYAQLPFSRLRLRTYFNEYRGLRLIRERLVHDQASGNQGTLLEFEILPTRDPNTPLEVDLASLFRERTLTDLQLDLFYKPAESGEEVQPGSYITANFNLESATLNFIPPGPGIYAIEAYFGVRSTPETPDGWEPTFHPPEVSAFSGSAVHTYPLLTPPGAAGLQPELSLSYNSSAANGVAGRIQGDPAGFGWVLSARVDVIQSLEVCENESDKICEAEIDLDGDKGTPETYNQYKLIFFSQGHELIHNEGRESNGDAGRYYAAGFAGLYVELCTEQTSSVLCSAHGNPGEEQVSRAYWLVKSPANTTFRLGFAKESEQAIRDGFAHEVTNPALKWRLDQATDRFGNLMKYTYKEDNYDGMPEGEKAKIGVESSYLETIAYQKNEIRFIFGDIPPFIYGPVEKMSVRWQRYLLGHLEIVHDEQLIREYNLHHAWQRHGQPDGEEPIDNQSEWCGVYTYPPSGDDQTIYYTLLLLGFTEKDSAGNSRVNGKQDVSYGYFFDGTAELNIPGSPNDIRYCNPYLDSYDTLYSPDPSESFGSVISYQYSGNRWYQPGDSDWKDENLDLYFHTVNEQVTQGGWADDAPDQYIEYQYANPYYQGIEDAFQGFVDVTVCEREEGGNCAGSAWLRKKDLSFMTRSYAGDQSTLSGKLLTRRTFEAGGSEPVLHHNTSWQMLSGAPIHARHPELFKEVVRDYRGGVEASARTEYVHDIYGNRTEVQEFGDDLSDEAAPIRTTETLYEPNITDGNWLVNLPWRATVWPEATGGPPERILSRVRYRYDGLPEETAPIDGKLTSEDILTCEAWDSSHICTQYDWATTTYQYGNDGGGAGLEWQLTRVEDPNGVWQRTDWLNETLVAFTTDAVGQTDYYYTDSNTPWLLTGTRQPNWAKTQYDYDTFGRLVTKWGPYYSTGEAHHREIDYTYQDAALPFYIESEVHDPHPDVPNWHTRTFYDALGRPLQQRKWGISSDFDQAITDTEYDALGRPACEMAPLGGSAGNYEFNDTLRCGDNGHTATDYDALNDIILVTDPGYNTTTTQYIGRSREITDAEDNTTVYTDDSLGRLVSVNEPPSSVQTNITSYSYDLADNLIHVAGPDGAETQIRYDLSGRKLYMNDPDMGEWTYGYDAGGRLVRQTDAMPNSAEPPAEDGQRFCFYYDLANRLLQKTRNGWGTGDCPEINTGTIRENYEYYDTPPTEGNLKPEFGQVEEITFTTVGTDKFDYDHRGRVIKHTRTIYPIGSTDGRVFDREMQYDVRDRPTWTTYDNGDSSIIVYDGQFPDTLRSVVDEEWNDIIVDQEYNHRQQLSMVTRPDGVPQTSYSYYNSNNNYLLEKIDHGAVAADQWPDYHYAAYDGLGNITQLNTSVNSEIESEEYSYDELGRLFTAKGTNSLSDYDFTYGYWYGGNLLSRNGTGGNRSYDYLSSEHHHAVTRISGGLEATFEYDANGNMTERVIDGITYSQYWDVENRLISVIVDGENTRFRYDADGQRVFTELPDGTEIYTPWPDYEEEEKVGGWIRRITYTLGDRAVGHQVRGHPDGSKNRRYHMLTNHQGSVVAVSNNVGDVIQDTIRYEPFGDYRGDPPDETNPSVTDRGYTSHKQNNSIELIYMGARYNMPGIGRFLSADTIVPDPANPQSLNRYSYGFNNPVKYIDPTGHSCVGALEGNPAEQGDCMAEGVNPLVFYLNGLGGRPDYPRFPGGFEYIYTLYALELLAGEQNVVHVPLFTEPYRRGYSHLDMIGEALGIGANQTRFAVQQIEQHLANNPLDPGQQLILVGSSAGGTVAIESLDLLSDRGIFVDQVVLRGSFVNELSINNVGRVDYITATPPRADPYYSVDINPFDSVNVNVHSIEGLTGHRPNTSGTTKIAGTVVDLIIDASLFTSPR